jgi:hypothetical protein
MSFAQKDAELTRHGTTDHADGHVSSCQLSVVSRVVFHLAKRRRAGEHGPMRTCLLLFVVLQAAVAPAALAPASVRAPWRVIVANDNCPDVTWGLTYEQTRQALADLVRAHLDEMNRTDAEPLPNRDHYTMTAAFEAESFVEKYPARKEEFVRRLREGRLCLSPFLCNSLWGFQSIEGALRTFYPARRMERDWQVPIDVAEHIELPSLPWGMASLMAGSGIRWASVPFYNYDGTFEGLKNPPLFRFVGPDGREVRVVMDAWASLRASYAQGAHLLQQPRRVTAEWIPHYEKLGAAYPLRVIFASGTHSDISPGSGRQARGFADAIIRYNAALTNQAQLCNGTLAQFCHQVDETETKAPFLPRVSGCFGHSWETWPVSLAATVAALRENERAYLAAESLLALAMQTQPGLAPRTRAEREKAEWCWAMLSDHAWNGTDLKNKRHNADLRRQWARQLDETSRRLTTLAWQGLGLEPDTRAVAVFNPLSFVRDCLVICEVPPEIKGMAADGQPVPSQLLEENGRRQIVFVAGQVPAFGFRQFAGQTRDGQAAPSPFETAAEGLEGPFYRLKVDTHTGGLSSLIHKPTAQELVVAAPGRSLFQTVFFDGREQTMTSIESAVVATGPVLARLRITGRIGDIRLTNDITLYAALDRVDFEARLEKSPSSKEQRLLHFFPVADSANDLRLETTAAVLRPRPQPDGDLLPGANTRRFAVQGLVDCSPAGRPGVRVAPLDSFLLRLDQGPPAFEALGNDQNYKEVTPDQDGVTHFRFRYSMCAHPAGYDNAAALAWSRSVATPCVLAGGRLPRQRLNQASLAVDPKRALALCLKPADGPASGPVLVRLWETSGRSGPVTLSAPAWTQATATDLLERERGELQMDKGQVSLDLRGHGFGAMRLSR